MAGTSAVAVGATAAGAILVWSGLKGASVLKTLQELVQGTRPAGRNVYPIGTPTAAPAGAAGADGGSAAAAVGNGDGKAMAAMAVSQIGVREGARNSQRYSRELGRPPEAWCADFVDWCAKQTGNSDVIPQTASAPGMAQAFGSRYHHGTDGIQIGDIVFQSGESNGWGGIGHVGICVSAHDMVAGNYGDKVARYAWNTGKTVGYARPGYKGAAAPPAAGRAHQADPARGE